MMKEEKMSIKKRKKDKEKNICMRKEYIYIYMSL
jgi:hypothetical protein